MLVVFAFLAAGTPAFSQEEDSSPFSVVADFYSSFIWRGSKYGTGPAIQPSVEYSSRGFTAGVWGSFDFRGYQETDLYFSFELPAGFNIGITDYYFPDLRFFDFSRETGSHALEINLGIKTGSLSLSGNYIINEAGGAGSIGNDLYFEAGYVFKYLTLFMGAGSGWHTYNSDGGSGKFKICNTGIEVSRIIKVTDTFEIPVTGQLIFNPDKEQLFVVVGFTL